MAEQSAFLTAFDEMQKKKGGLNAPAPLESVVDTVGQAPAVQSPFSQQAAAATNPLAAPIDLSAVRQAPMLGGFEVKGAGAERFDVGTPEVPETLFSKEYTDPGGNTAAIARIEGERARANAVDPQVSVETPKEFTPTGGAGFLPASSVPVPRDTPDGATFMGDVSTGLGKLSAPFTAHSQAAGGFKPEQPESTIEPFVGNTQTADMRGQDIKKSPIDPTAQPGREGSQFAERGSPQDFFLSNTNGGTTALSPEQITRGQEYAKQQGLNFDPTTGFSQSGEAPQVQAPQGLTTAGGQPLAEFLAGGQQKDAQGRMIDPNVDRSSFEQKSADREARQAARPDFGEAVSDRDRRAARGEGISDADRRDIAKAQSPNASASDRARGMKVAEKAGLDWRTGQPLKQDKETGGLTDYQAITAQQRQTEIDLKIADGMEEKEAKSAVAYEESRSNVRSTQDSFDKLRPVAEEIALLSGSKFTEGALGWTASKLPFSTDAAQIERLTTEFEGSAFLQGLIDAKAKGATFGALSEREGDRILGQWGKITSPKSTNKERIRAVNSMLESIQRSSERAASDHKEKFPDRSASSSKAKAQGSPEGKRHAKDQDHGAKVETYFQT